MDQQTNITLCKCDCDNSTSDEETFPPPFKVRTSQFEVSGKELFILLLFFILLLYAVISFLSQWNKNYREINHLPYYEIYIGEENPQLPGPNFLLTHFLYNFHLNGKIFSLTFLLSRDVGGEEVPEQDGEQN